MSKYWSDIVRRLEPYVPGEQSLDQQYIKLNTNESPYPPSPQVAQAIHNYDMDTLRLYPDPESLVLRSALATRHNLVPAQVFVGNGSDEVLAHCFLAFFQQSSALLFPDISYSFYPVYCALYAIEYQQIALDDKFAINVDDYSQANGGIILPNPNAPTGIALSLDSIRRLLEAADSVVIIDEAYVDFGAESADSLVEQYDNLLVTQTFSKSRNLAGLRLGYALGHSELIEALNRVKNSFNSYPIDRLASVAAIASVNDQSYFETCNQNVIDSRNRLSSALLKLGFQIYPSAANFIFVEHQTRAAAELYQALKRHGILVRYFQSARIDNCLRITVGTDAQCRQLVQTLASILQS
ncbi:MAG: histidinol-phosphate transaminase [Gammaproteobacteria bacterium]|nr:histidinol-phosphate transaminase [Gammaproteobacteria bacterium]